MSEKIATASSYLVYIGLFVVTFLAGFILFQISKASGDSKNRRSGCSATGCLGLLILLLFFASVLFFYSFKRAYNSFTREELIGIVQCERAPGSTSDFQLKLTRVIDGVKQTPENYLLNGDQWVLGGSILQWESYMNFLGMTSMYKLTHLQGIHNQNNGDSDVATSFPLTDQNQGGYWAWLYDNAHKMPFIKSAHTNLVGTNPYYGSSFQIMATTSGFTLIRIDPQGKTTTMEKFDNLMNQFLGGRAKRTGQE